MSTRIILADDHKIVRDGLAALLAKVPGLEVVAEAADGRTAVRLAREMLPDVVIMDISMPDLNGIEATRQIVAEVSGVKVIALSMHSGRRLVMEVFKAGASGYLFKDCAFEELASAIRSVVAGDTYLSPKIAGVMVKELATQSLTDTPVAFSVLTAREREVLQLLAEGKTTKKIASLLHLSTKTVETHRQQIMKKLNIHSVAELTRFAIREGLVSLDT
ncbi:MAG: response regulator transcription factor [Bacillota bacterium]|jgi:DNA-binding NarL/FixJ family response regulator